MGNVSANAQDTRHHAHPRPSRRHDRDEPQQHLAGDQARRAHRYKDHNDVWHVDGAELARAFPVTPPIAQLAPQDAPPTRWPLTSSPSPRNASPSLRNASKK